MSEHYYLPLTLHAPVRTTGLQAAPKIRLKVMAPTQPLLRLYQPGEPVPEGPWGTMLADLGWTWAITVEDCRPELPSLMNAWVPDWKADTPPWQEWALAVRLKLLPFRADLPPEHLRQVLGLALVQQDAQRLFDLSQEAPDWEHDMLSARFERQATTRRRQPGHPWLDKGYELIHQAFWNKAMDACTSLIDYELLWEAHFANAELPLAFELVYWWEIHYRLSERQRETDAHQALERVAVLSETLGQITEAMDPWWSLQQARNLYYAGNLPDALRTFHLARKRLRKEAKAQPSLLRHTANVLSDMGCLKRAYELTRQALNRAETLGLQDEHFKALGRLGELALKLGDPDTAESHYQASLEIQRQRGDALNRTLIYLGHTALLAGNLASAEQCYGEARRNADESAFPYLLMGEAALAKARNDQAALTALWEVQGETWESWLSHPTRVLPAAVALLATRQVHHRDSLLGQAFFALLDHQYLLEALGFLGVSGLPVREAWRAALKDRLNRWREALDNAGEETNEFTTFLAWMDHPSPHLPPWAYPLTLAAQSFQNGRSCGVEGSVPVRKFKMDGVVALKGVFR